MKCPRQIPVSLALLASVVSMAGAVDTATQHVARHKAIFVEPPRHVPSPGMPDGPLLGNGDVGVAIAGPPQEQRFYIGKNDFWRRDPADASVMAVGAVSLSMPALREATYRQEQDLALAEVRGSFGAGDSRLLTRSWVDANENLLVSSLYWEGKEPLVVLVRQVTGADATRTNQPAQERRGHSEEKTSTLWFTRRADALPGKSREVAVATRILGAPARPGGDGGLQVTLRSGRTVQIVSSILSDLDAPDCLEAAKQRVAAWRHGELETLAAQHRKWWSDFWSRSFIEIPDEEIEKRWYAALYFLGSCSRAGKVAPGLWGNWVATEKPNWHGDFHLNYNFEAPYYIAYSANHADLSAPYYQAICESVPNGRAMAKRHGWKGVHFPVCIGPWGLSPENPDEDWGQRSDAAFAALNFIWQFQYTQDLGFLRTNAYPYLREVADFWEDYLKLEAGRYVIYNDSIHEGSGADMNPLLSLGLVRTLFTNLISMSTELGLDAERRPKWKDVCQRISAFPVQERGGKEVFRYSEKGTAWVDGNTLGIHHIFPAGAIGLDSDPRLLAICRNTIDAMSRWHDDNGFSSWYTACVRVGYDPRTILTNLRKECNDRSYPNLLLYYGGGGIENLAGFLAINEMLLQSHEGVIRLFPVWPADLNARFGSLRAAGAFLVSAQLQNGLVRGVKVSSEKGRPCTIQNPWPSRKVRILRPGRAGEIATGGRFTVQTAAGETFELEPRADADSAGSSLAQEVTLPSLLAEMTDRDAVARYPQPEYRCLQASSYNRASTNRNQPDQTVTGWFADSDGLGFIRTEVIAGRQEWVIMEHEGPGCLTKLWTPYFYYGFDDLKGPNIRIYLDGQAEPVLDESLIELVTGKGSFRPPFSSQTTRAGDSYLPIPFAKSCKVTMAKKPFYYIINYRAYPEGTRAESFTRARYETAARVREKAAEALTELPDTSKGAVRNSALLQAGGELAIPLRPGPRAVRQFTVRLPGAVTNSAALRSTVIAMTFDEEETSWCPIGDFFCSADALHQLRTWQRTTDEDGTMVCRWVMPYREKAELRVLNLGDKPVELALQIDLARWRWDERSLHFHANWRPDDVVPGTPFQDWNYIDIRGKGVFVGDAWTVLNIQGSWWGEGDEKIYVDDAWDRGFPTHFGTGTEDYYGWAGGEVPTRKDEFSVPFLANVRVGGLDGFTTGFNICTRTRSLDAIPFRERIVFDMESSFGTDIRNPWNLLGYSAVTFWYARPGATHNRPALPAVAARPIMSLEKVKAHSEAIRNATKSGGVKKAEKSDQSTGRRAIQVFVVAGQSNAEGHNDIRQYRGGKEPFPESLRKQSEILYWLGSDKTDPKENRWKVLTVGDSGSFGPEISFAHEIEKVLPETTIGIVKYAVGGTGIARSADYTDYIPALANFNDKGRNWHPPEKDHEPGALYHALIFNVQDALAALERDGKQARLAGFVWMQGEHEAGISRRMAEDYTKLLTGFISSVRKDLQAPSLPFAIGRVNSHTWAYGDIARASQVEACRQVNGTLLVETTDLPRVDGDAAHFTADGMLLLGSRFAEAMAKLMAQEPKLDQQGNRKER
jgi:alpha-L-fucosidase 2